MKIHCKYDELVNPKNLKNYSKNRNKHPQSQIDRLARMYEHHGIRHPIIIDQDRKVIAAGHGRKLAAIRAGLKEFPVVYQKFETEEDLYTFCQADNALTIESELDLSGINLDIGELGPFDLDKLGIPDFTVDAADKYEDKDPDEIPEEVEPVAKLGQTYKLGNHRLMCGDSTSEEDVSKLMNGEKADLLHTDPPYNVDYSNQDRPKAGKVNFGRIKNDTMDSDSFYNFLKNAFHCGFINLKQDSSAYIWYASKESVNFMKSCEDAGFEINQQIIWKKPMLLGRGRYQWAHEPCLFAIKGKPYFTDDRKKTTVWDFGGYDKSKNVHPTQKPHFIPEEAINNSSKIGSNVLDLFGGSGSTLIACEKTNRKCFMMELDPHYVDVIIARWEKFTGQKAELING